LQEYQRFIKYGLRISRKKRKEIFLGDLENTHLIAVLLGVRYVRMPVTLIQHGFRCTSSHQEPLY
jgi:hypothetical protein